METLTGVESIEIGIPGANGALPSSWLKIMDIEDDSVSFTVPPKTTNKIRVEDRAGIRMILPSKTTEAPTFNLGTIDISGKNAKQFLGGTYNEGTDTYSAPSEDDVIIEASLRFTSKAYGGKKKIFTYPLTILTASFNGNMTYGAVVSIRAVAEVLTPTNSSGVSLPPWTMKTVAVVTAPTVFNTTQTFVSAASATSEGVTTTLGATDPDAKFEFDKITTPSGSPNNMEIEIGGTVQASVDFPGDYAGDPFRYTDTSGVTHTGVFTNGTVEF